MTVITLSSELEINIKKILQNEAEAIKKYRKPKHQNPSIPDAIHFLINCFLINKKQKKFKIIKELNKQILGCNTIEEAKYCSRQIQDNLDELNTGVDNDSNN